MQPTETITKTQWIVDPAHSEVGFRVKHLMFANVRGTFREFSASIYTVREDFTTAEIEFWINPASVYTGIEQRDNHLRSEDFFDAENFGEIVFKSGTMTANGKPGHFRIHGTLTMRGHKESIELDATLGGIIKDPYGSEKALFSIEGKINRKKWGLNYNSVLETGGLLISEDVWIVCEIQLMKKSI